MQIVSTNNAKGEDLRILKLARETANITVKKLQFYNSV